MRGFATVQVWRASLGKGSAVGNTQALLEKIEALPAARVAEVEDFVDFVTARERDQTLRSDFASRGSAAFARVWDNPEDSIYDEL